MNLTNQPVYQARHPESVLVTPEFPHGAAALNALFDRDMWERDEDVGTGMADETIDIDTEVGRWRAGRDVQGTVLTVEGDAHRDARRPAPPAEVLYGV